MKIRRGFVSNSSSASYIVKIHGQSLENLSEMIPSEYLWSAIDETRTIIGQRKETIKNLCKPEYQEEELKKIDELEKQINNAESPLEKIKALFEYNDIKYSEENDLILTYFTSMHNDYNEGMCNLLKEIVLYTLFEGKNKITCEVEHDQ